MIPNSLFADPGEHLVPPAGKWLLLLLLWGFFAQSATAAEPLVIREFNHYGLGHSLELMEDPTGSLSFEEVRTPAAGKKFTASRQTVPNLGFTKSAYWARFRIDASFRVSADEKWLLELSHPFVDELDVYIPQGKGRYEVRNLGDRKPFWSRDWSHRNFVINLNYLDHAPQEYYYLRISTPGTLHVPLDLWTVQAFGEHAASEQLLLGLYYGIMIAMLLYNLFIYFTTRDHTYIRYVSFIACFLILQANTNGHFFQYLVPPYPSIANVAIPLFIALSCITAVWFTIDYLEIKKLKPKLMIAFKVALAANAATAVAVLLLPYSIGFPVSFGVAAVTVVMLLAAGLITRRAGSRPAQFYNTAWSILLLGSLVKLLAMAGVFPQNMFTNHTWQLGSALEVLLLSLGLADRINDLREERMSALQQAFEFEKIAHTDRLTGLYNRTYFEREFKQHKEYSQRNPNSHFGLFIIDLIGLKSINDNYGHGAGDQAIRMTARILKSLCRQSDVVARIGGDEYAIICPRLNFYDYEAFVTRMIERTEGGTIKYQDGDDIRTIPIHLSIGHGHTARIKPAEIFDYADKEMYRCKEEFYLTHKRYRTVQKPVEE